MKEARLKLEFPEYESYEEPVKSLISYMMNASVAHLGSWVDVDPSSRPPYEPMHFDLTHITNKKKKRYQFKVHDLPEDSYILVNGTFTCSINKSLKFNVTNQVFKLDASNSFVVKADNAYYDGFDLRVDLLPPVDYFACTISPSNYTETSGYMIGISCSDPDNHTFDDIGSAVAYGNVNAEGVYMTVQDLVGTAGNNRKVIFRKPQDYTEQNRKIDIELYNSDALVASGKISLSTEQHDKYDHVGFGPSSYNTRGKVTRESDGRSVSIQDYLFFSNYYAENGIIYFNFTDTDEIVFNFSKGSDTPDYKSLSSGTLIAYDYDLQDTINTYLTLYETPFTFNIRGAKPTNEFIQIPVTISVDKPESVKAENAFPLSFIFTKDNLIYPNYPKSTPLPIIVRPKVLGNVKYQLKTDSFTIHDTVTDKSVDAYYKIGICANDGTLNSTNTLLNDFVSKTYLTVYTYYEYSLGRLEPPIFAIKPKDVSQNIFYSISDSLIMLDKKSTFVFRNRYKNIYYWDDTVGDYGAYNYDAYPTSAPSNALVPLLEIDASTSEHTLKGVMYIQLFDAKTNKPITEEFNSADDEHHEHHEYEILINGESAMDANINMFLIDE